ncbi:hypothetical protein D0864_04956 [Hortaea werneckii]|uniref:Expansin-like EG45 domain-containing protein n=1 Tax=Hortaea werneckii TaxID=91943 RepID=A0A3M7G775_HORWE|nr:hypothetical protein D0864_04956 [Hortaea werneckii]
MYAKAAALMALASTAFAAITPGMTLDERSLAKRSLSGEATFYGGNVQGGTCSFSTYELPEGLYGTALSDSNWNNAYNCGGCVRVNHGGKSVTAMIVDQCPGCGDNHLDLFPDAFKALEDPSVGVMDITWDYVSCPTDIIPVSEPLSIHMKSGVSQYWFSAQVVGARRRTAKLEVSTDQGNTWQEAKRTTYNFFEISSGVGASSAWIRATSHVGTTVVVKDVQMTGDSVTKGPKNYV